MKDLEKEINNVKNKINNIDLDENFKEELNHKLTLEYEKENKNNKKKIFYFPKQAVAAILCIVILSSCVFADEIEHFVLGLFHNTDISIEEILENKNLQKFDMEYVEKDGIKMKIDYALVEKDSIYLVFNVLSEENIDKIYLDKFALMDENKNIIFDSTHLKSSRYALYNKKINDKNSVCILEINNVKTIKRVSQLDINISSIIILSNEKMNQINNKWIFYINLINK